MKNKIKISVVTATFNSSKTLKDCLASVSGQSYSNYEHIVVDGASTDKTIDIVNEHINQIAIFRSEHDKGIYNALNKGFLLASGDVVGILHSDDVFYCDSVLEQVANAFEDKTVDYVYGDIEMINADGKQMRYWKAGPLLNGRIVSTQIPHPSLFLSKRLLKRVQPAFDDTYRISADLKQQLIFTNVLHASGAYIASPLVKMRVGGTSTANFKAYIDGWIESRRAWNEVHGSGGSLYVLRKVISKLKGVRF